MSAAEATEPTTDLWNALPAPVVLLRPDGRAARANTAAESFLNASQAQLADRGLAQVLPPDSPVLALADDARARGWLAAYDLPVEFIGGRRLRADVLASVPPDAPGWLQLLFQPRSVAALVDRQVERQGSARSAAGVAAMLAHEIKNPLSGIRGAAQLLAQDAGEDAREFTALIISEVDRIRTLIDRMEGFTDTRPVTPRAENIHAILGHVRKLGEQGFARGLTIRERYDPSLPPVLGNRDALVQLFINLLKNAAEASAPGGEILLSTAFRHGLSVTGRGGGRRVSLPLEVCVIDGGEGPPADVADHMFDPFVSGKRGGTGLGLALAAKVVSDHGGVIEHERRDGRTLFRVLLPVAREP